MDFFGVFTDAVELASGTTEEFAIENGHVPIQNGDFHRFSIVMLCLFTSGYLAQYGSGFPKGLDIWKHLERVK